VGQQNLAIEVSERRRPSRRRHPAWARCHHQAIDNLPLPNRAATALVSLSPAW